MWRNISYKRITNLDRLGLLLWKNYLLIVRTQSKILTLIFVPLLLLTVFIGVKLALPDEYVDHMSYEPLNLTSRPAHFTNRCHLAFIGNDFKEAPQLMKEVQRILQLNHSVELFAAAELEQHMEGLEKTAAGGVIFHKSHENLTVEIRVAGLPTQLTSVQHWWQTARLYPHYVEVFSRFYSASNGGPVPGYVRSGFVAIQSAISEAYLKQKAKVQKLPFIQLQRFPHPPYTYRTALHTSKILLQIGTVVGFYFVCLYNVKVRKSVGN